MPLPMSGNERLETFKVRETISSALVKVKEDRGDTFLCVQTDALLKTLETLKNDPELDYSYFSECVGVDYSTWPHERDFPGKRFEVVYNLFSLKYNSRIFVKVAVNDGESIPTAKHIFLGAEYPEREINDLYGVIFEGNSDHVGRFLLPDDWVGYPLRKEYPLGGEDVLFDQGHHGPAVEDTMKPHAGSSFDGKTGSQDVSGR